MTAHLSNEEMDMALSLLQKATDYQLELDQTVFKYELIERAIPVIWFGEKKLGNIVTIGTNPSSREFLGKDGETLTGDKARFYVREEGSALEIYKTNPMMLSETIESYQTYFYRDTAYRSWFGTKHGAKLEGFLNGMGGSLYPSDSYAPVVHTDFLPIPTRSQMAKIRKNELLLDSDYAKQFIVETLDFLKPSLIIVLGRQHCDRFDLLNPHGRFSEVKSLEDYPAAKYQIGTYSRLNVPVVGLHFKPSEQFIGLEGKRDVNGISHGEYGKKSSLHKIGEQIKDDLEASVTI